MTREQDCSLREKHESNGSDLRWAIDTYGCDPQDEICIRSRPSTENKRLVQPVRSDVSVNHGNRHRPFSRFWDIVFSSIIDLDGETGNTSATVETTDATRTKPDQSLKGGDLCLSRPRTALADMLGAAPNKRAHPNLHHVFRDPIPCWPSHGNHDVVVYYVIHQDLQGYEEICRARLNRTRLWMRRQVARAGRRVFRTKTKVPPETGSDAAAAAAMQQRPLFNYEIMRPAWRAERRAPSAVSEPLEFTNDNEPFNMAKECWRIRVPGAVPELHQWYRPQGRGSIDVSRWSM